MLGLMRAWPKVALADRYGNHTDEQDAVVVTASVPQAIANGTAKRTLARSEQLVEPDAVPGQSPASELIDFLLRGASPTQTNEELTSSSFGRNVACTQ